MPRWSASSRSKKPGVITAKAVGHIVVDHGEIGIGRRICSPLPHDRPLFVTLPHRDGPRLAAEEEQPADHRHHMTHGYSAIMFTR